MFKAIEILLYHVFVDNYLKYLMRYESRINLDELDDYLTYVDRRLNKKRIKRTLRDFSCGKVPGIVADEGDVRIINKINGKDNQCFYPPNEYFCEFCEKCGIKDAYTFVIKFHENVKELCQLRNETAHRNRILPDDAKKSFDLLIKAKKFINNLYQDFAVCFKEN